MCQSSVVMEISAQRVQLYSLKGVRKRMRKRMREREESLS
jgi:hypothetical protein